MNDFSGQHLVGADFSGQKLSLKLTFQGANLTGVNFSGATISYANFSDAILKMLILATLSVMVQNSHKPT